VKILFGLAALTTVASLAALACGAGAGQQGGDPGVRFKAGKGPGSLALADLNGDGRLDLVVANDEDDTVTVLLGDGKGGFRAAPGSPFPAGKSPNDIAIADFDGDGKPDLAFPNHDSKYVTILIGDGRGGFSPAAGSPVAVQSRPHPHGIAAADFDGDGHVDFAVESWGNDQVEVVFGAGGGRFRTPGRLYGVGKMPYQKLRAGDVNGDGAQDLVTTNFEGGNVTVLLGDGKGGFHEAPGSPFPAGASPFSLALADLNGDGHLDIVAANFSGQGGDTSRDAVNVLLGDGRGGFRPMKGSPFASGANPVGVAVGDVNGDGRPDVVTANMSGGDVTVLLGDGRGSFLPGVGRPAGKEPYRVAVGDVDRDGRAEIFVANHGNGDVTMIRFR
jgi:FG-GAP-like repeat